MCEKHVSEYKVKLYEFQQPLQTWQVLHGTVKKVAGGFGRVAQAGDGGYI